ncbi:hypothetical protein ACN28S_13215 [Cystobacter fuscus]
MFEEETQEATRGAQAAVAEPPERGLLTRIIEEGRLARDDSQQPRARELVSELVEQALTTESIPSDVDLVALINQRIARIDELLGAQLDEVLHAEPFQRLEAPGGGCTCWSMAPRRGRT